MVYWGVMKKAQALRLARQLRSEGKTVKVFRHEGIYTQPFKGIATFCYYEVKVVA